MATSRDIKDPIERGLHQLGAALSKASMGNPATAQQAFKEAAHICYQLGRAWAEREKAAP